MIDDTIGRIEKKLENTNITDETRAELMKLLGELKNELKNLSDEEKAESVAGFAEVSAREAMRENSEERLVNLSIEGLHASVEELESSNPILTRVVNSICMLLSNSGI